MRGAWRGPGHSLTWATSCGCQSRSGAAVGAARGGRQRWSSGARLAAGDGAARAATASRVRGLRSWGQRVCLGAQGLAEGAGREGRNWTHPRHQAQGYRGSWVCEDAGKGSPQLGPLLGLVQAQA